LQACIIAGISGPGLDTHISTLFLCRHVVRDPCRRRPGTAATDIYFSQEMLVIVGGCPRWNWKE